MWEGSWSGNWDGYWFGQSGVATVSMSADLAGTATLTATLSVIDLSALREGAIQIPGRMSAGYNLEESMLTGLQFSVSMSYDYESSGHWMSAGFAVVNSLEQWVTPIDMPMGEYDGVYELEVELDVDSILSVTMEAGEVSIGPSMSDDVVTIGPSMSRSLLAGMSMTDEYNITTPLIMG